MWKRLQGLLPAGSRRRSRTEHTRTEHTGTEGSGTRRPAPSTLIGNLVVSLDESGDVLDSGQAEVVDGLGALTELPEGIYLHGDVGRGKSWLADQFFDQLPGPRLRLHCHELLADINASIARRFRAETGEGARQTRGTAELIASVVSGYDFIMLDDFHVHDVADGELLFIILKELAVSETFMLLTSNCPPESLLPNPQFHETFLPAIELIDERCLVIAIAPGRDHRQDADHLGGFASGTWATTGLAGSGGGSEHRPHLDEGTAGLKEGMARSEGSKTFAELCGSPWSAADYFVLMRGRARLELTEVPAPADIDKEAFQRFAFLIDALVDQDVAVDVESVADRQAFADADNLPRDADRMLSRLGLLRAAEALSR